MARIGHSVPMIPQSLRHIRKLYQKRMDDYKASIAVEAQQPKVVRPDPDHAQTVGSRY